MGTVDNKSTLVAIDPGTKCGWAVRHKDGRMLQSGTWDLKGSRFEGAGMRFLRLRNYLTHLIDMVEPVALVYEEVRGHKGVDAAHIYGGIVAVLTEECEAKQVPYCGVPVGTIKKFATGKGNSGKSVMLSAAKLRWEWFAGDDNEADALWLAECYATDSLEWTYNYHPVYDIG